MSDERKIAIFEVITPERVYRIWPDGRVEGWENHHTVLVVNRIPQLLARAVGDKAP